MKITIKRIVVVVAIMVVSAVQTFAIEGLTLSIQSSNVVLSWPSDPTSGETFIIQSRASIGTNDAWQTLTNFYPALDGTNVTTFVHTGAACVPAGVTNSSGGSEGGPPSPGFSSSSQSSKEDSFPPLPPLPPLPWDTSTWVANNSTKHDKSSSSNSELDNPTPEDSDGDGSSCSAFYRVVRNGVQLFAITNGMALSNTVTIQIEVGNDGGKLQSVTLSANGTSIPGVNTFLPPFTNLVFTIDTTRLNNGVNALQAQATWNLSTNEEDETEALISLYQADSPSIEVNIFNEISFPEWVDNFGEGSLSLNVSSDHLDVDWQIDIYDDQFSYLGSFTNHTTDGKIEVVWDGTDGQGHTNASPVFYSVTTTTFQGGSKIKVNPPKFKVTDNFPSVGGWVVAFQNVFAFKNEDFKNQSEQPNMQNQVLSAFRMASVLGGNINPNPNYPGNYFGGLYDTNIVSYTNQTWGWTQLKWALQTYQARNFYYFGHGNKSKLGSSPNAIRFLTSAEVAAFLNITSTSTNRHHYRYVFLDGCNTANGDWPLSFGIRKKENVLIEEYSKNNLRPSAFSGWTDYKTFAVLNKIPWQFPAYRINFFALWGLNNRTLFTAHDTAKRNSEPNTLHVGESLKIYGFSGLRGFDYNTNP